MKARLVKAPDGSVKLLFIDGSFSKATKSLLANLIINFKKVEHFEGRDGSWHDSAADMAFYPGETIAIVTDNLELIIYSGDVFQNSFISSAVASDFVTTSEFAKIHGKSVEIIKVLCRQNKISGVEKVGRSWMIPRNAPYPIPEKHQRPKTCGPRPAENKASK